MSPSLLIYLLIIYKSIASSNSKSSSSKSSSKTPKLLPDFILHEDEFSDIAIRTEYFPADDCQIIEGCVNNIGERTVIRFTTAVGNIGTVTFNVGNPALSNLAIWDNCHSHYHVNNYVFYDIFDINDINEEISLAEGGKKGFCVQDGKTDTSYIGNDREESRYTNCSYQGIGIGRMDEYAKHIICQFVDITDLAAGDYILRGTVNKYKIIKELNYDNNVARVQFNYNGNPSSYYVSNFIPNESTLTNWRDTKNSLLDGDKIHIDAFPDLVPFGLVDWLDLYNNGASKWCFSPGPCFGDNKFLEVSFGLTQLLTYFNVDILMETVIYGNGYFYVEGYWIMETITNCLYPSVRTEFYVYYDENGNILREIAIADNQNAFVSFEEKVFWGGWVCTHPTDYIIPDPVKTPNIVSSSSSSESKDVDDALNPISNNYFFTGNIGKNVIELSETSFFIISGIIVIMMLSSMMLFIIHCKFGKIKKYTKIDQES